LDKQYVTKKKFYIWIFQMKDNDFLYPSNY